VDLTGSTSPFNIVIDNTYSAVTVTKQKVRCCTCGDDLPERLMSKGRSGPNSRRCKLCTCEEAKASIRYSKSWPMFIKDLPKWHDRKIVSEIEWLERKLAALEAEQQKRISRFERN
jgi:hypothetical protein